MRKGIEAGSDFDFFRCTGNTVTETELIFATVWRYYPPNRFAVCDRVAWGLGLNYEADAIAISDTGLTDELEAKSSLSDLKADLKKHKWKLIETGMRDYFADRFWYVVPEKLREAAVKQAEPRGFGVVVVSLPEKGYTIGDAERVLKAKQLRKGKARRLDQRAGVWRLAAIRYWSAVKNRLDRDYQEKT